GDEGKIIVEFVEQSVALGGQRAVIGTRGTGLPVVDPDVALEHLKARADFMDAVVDGFQFGGFVDYVFGRGDLAAIVHPGRNVQGFPVVGVGLKVGECRCVAGGGGLGEHHGEFRYALAVTAGVGAFGVDGAGDDLNEGVQQLLLFVQQPLAFNAQGGGAGDGFDEGDALRLQQARVVIVGATVPVGQQQYADGIALAVMQPAGEQVGLPAVELIQ